MPGAVTHPRFPARRSVPRPASWWGRAWQRAVEESAYGEADLRAGRSLARAGAVGQVTAAPGGLLAAVREGDDAWTTTVRVPVLAPDEVAILVELVAAEAGRLPGLLAGDLPHQLVEDAEESGVELLPYGGELAAECTCAAWTPPCPHAIALLSQAGWLLDRDPLTLLLLRGLPREDLLAGLHARVRGADPEGGPDEETDADVETAHDAALRAARILDRLDRGAEVPDHLF
ncbi:hypothetical protein IE331_00405 [Nocardioides sp. MJB4]|uniref:SWIM-type domain-containing protein n=1 Tax=Nocardioides donggukensis TaxID=2774019 RepID=A0A927K193_9ACTN|nr:hypothetical protein [Nocardioides donggukensis]